MSAQNLRRLAVLLLAASLGLAIPPGALQAQAPPAAQADPQGSAVSTGQTMETPLPTKVLGQVLVTSKYAVAGEATYILQDLFAFRSSYTGPNSFRSRRETEISHTYTLYAGARPNPRLELYANPELAFGNGIGAGQGLAAYTNGDLIGQPALTARPYLARLFARWRVPLRSQASAKSGQTIARGNDVFGGEAPASRLVLTLGKLALSDHIDINAYANNARTQFQNNAFINNLAYDKAADPRGYTNGLIVSWITPSFTLRAGTAAMPTAAGVISLAYNPRSLHAEQAELELHPALLPRTQNAVLRLLAYRNVGPMGRYRDALQSTPAGLAPDVTAVRRRGAVKYGFGLNFEQGLGDGGATGIFGRLGWNDGATETFSYAEADRSVSLGGQVCGVRWHRPNDVLGVALAQSDLSSAHKEYLAAGGLGLSLGDGRLNYAPECVAETYYSYQISPHASLSPDYQLIRNPGYNHDRGPASVLSLRLHLTF